MAIDPKEIKSIEDSMVHDVDEEPHPEGWGVYATLRFLSKAVLAVYGLMLFGMLVLQVVMRNTAVPLFLRPESTLLALPIAVVAAYLYFTSEPELELAHKRTRLGKIITVLIVFIGLQAFSILSWVAIVKAFSLH